LITAEPPVETTPAPLAQQGDAEVPIPRPSNGVLPSGAADKVLPVGSPPIVRLLEPGAEPRADLSYAFVKGATQRMGMGSDMAAGMKTRQGAIPQTPMPHMTMLLDTTDAEKNAMGEHRMDLRLTSVSVDPNGAQQEQMARALKPQTDAMKGLGVSYWVSPKGMVRDVKIDMPSTIPPAAQALMAGLSESFESIVVPLPAGAVGVGARWQVVTRVSRGGADLIQSSIYTLKARSGSRASLEFTVVHLAGNDLIHTPQMPPAMNAKLKSFSSSGSGSTSLDLRSVVPDSANMTIRSAMTLSVQAAADTEESTVETTTSVQTTRP
jgi:hypothetical protein